MADNKIKFGLKNVHYAKATIAADGSATYGTVKPWPGGVSLSMDPEGEATVFFADNIEYATFNANSGYSGNLESALVPDDFRKDILGDIEDANGNLIEDANAPTEHFALLFQFEGDQNAVKHCFYNCTAQRPSVNGATKEQGVEVQTETVNISARSIHDVEKDKDYVKAKCPSTSSDYATWFEAVKVPTFN